MGIKDGIFAKKRKKFYESIKNISFDFYVDIENLDEKDLSTAIKKELAYLIKAIKAREKSSEKSESNKYFGPLLNAANYLLENLENDQISEDILSCLARLQDDCLFIAEAKFNKTTFGAVLEYQPTLDKFLMLSKQLFHLGKELNNYLKSHAKSAELKHLNYVNGAPYVYKNISKRKKFYESIKNTSFDFEVDIENLNEKKLLRLLNQNLEDLIAAIRTREKSSGKSESDHYLDSLSEAAKQAYEQMQSGKIDEKTTQALEDLHLELLETAKAKFAKTTFRAVLDYQPTLDHFKKLSQEIFTVGKKLLTYLGLQEEYLNKYYYNNKAPSVEKNRVQVNNQINVMVFGNKGVGKTALIKKLCGKVSKKITKNGFEGIKTYLDSGTIRCNNVNIFEIKKDLNDLNNSFAKKLEICHFALFMFDVNDQINDNLLESLYTASETIKHNNYKCHIIFVGNKMDLLKNHKVTPPL